jgi:hypothetical protein
LRNTLITVIGLPVIAVAAFWGMSLFGFTLNMITLLALSLCIGLLIDDAISAGVDFLLSTDPAKADYPCGYTTKPSGNWWKLVFQSSMLPTFCRLLNH